MKTLKKPVWIKSKINISKNYFKIHNYLKANKLNTVCEEAKCPNKHSCWNSNEITFIILGKICTRNCKFCNIQESKNYEAVDKDEPSRIAKAISDLNIEYAIITSVTRDDLPTFGANHFYNTIKEIKRLSNTPIEVLIPDFNGSIKSLNTIINAKPNIIGHNMETVERLYKKIRPKSSYKTSIRVLKYLKENSEIPIKTSIMVGLGETKKELIKTIKEIQETGTDILYIGQYLRPTKKHYPVMKFYSPDEFEELKDIALKMGIKNVLSGVFVRSSFKAKQIYLSIKNN